METEINLYSGTIHSHTAGLSPLGEDRAELFFAGCKMARKGNPCKGCFNKALWSNAPVHLQTASEIVNYLDSMNAPKFVTIVGGEPLDQKKGLAELLRELHNDGYHICLITHYTLGEAMDIMSSDLGYVNLLIDGRYDASLRIFDTDKRPGVLHVIGSSNQKIWFNNKGKWLNVTNKHNLLPYYTKRWNKI